MMNTVNDFVNISIRIKPQSQQQQKDAGAVAANTTSVQRLKKNPAILLLADRSQTYHFDNIFDDADDQEAVYIDTVRPLTDRVKAGYNCTVFAYGQTGTGKTYTMGTNPDISSDKDIGIISRTLDDFFEWDADDSIAPEVDILVSFIEIYNENVFDLLNERRTAPLPIKGFTLQEVRKERVGSTYEAKRFLRMGGRRRHVGETKQNSSSSRSHAIYTIYCNVKHSDNETAAKLNLVDLAGSESVRKTGNHGNMFQEGVNINKGLLCIGQVMTALCNNRLHIPYRQSIITTILQDSLNKKNYVSLIACISANNEDSCETARTLEFANRLKKMRNKPEVNRIIKEYNKENPEIFARRFTPGSAVKRPNNNGISNTPYATPFNKRAKIGSMADVSIIPEADNSGAVISTAATTALDSPRSLFSMSVSSISNSAVQQSFSPIVKKCMSIMESTFLGRMEDVIRDTLRKSRMQSMEMRDKENTPRVSMSWDKIQNEVSRIVRKELLQFTAKATSSPIINNDLNSSSCNTTSNNDLDVISLPKRVLNYDDDLNISSTNSQENLPNNNDQIIAKDMFKVPAVPMIIVNRLKGHKSPNIIKGRQSLRLQLKESHHATNNPSPVVLNKSLNKGRRTVTRKSSAPSHNNSNVRRSGRIREKRVKLDADEDDVVGGSSSSGVRSTSTDNKEKQLVVPIKHPRIVKLKTKSATDSPVTAHTRQVLYILNKGDAKEIGKLHGVGVKTAAKILLFRKLKGRFRNISDLSDMPDWKGKRYEKFLSQNFLRSDEPSDDT